MSNLKTDKVKRSLVSIGGISQLLKMTNSIDIRVKRNASGAILNITHLRKYPSFQFSEYSQSSIMFE